MLKNKLIKNIFSLSMAEFANKGIAMLINMYIARIFNVEGFGIIAIISAIMQYALMFVNLGFATTGMRTIAKNTSNDKIVSSKNQKYVNNIISLKLALATVSYLFIIAYVFATNQTFLMRAGLLLGGLQVFAVAFQIDWFYHGIERMEILGLRQLLISTVTFIGVILFVHQPSDIPLYMGITSISLLLNNLWLIVLYIKRYAKIKLQILLPLWKKLAKESLIVAGPPAIVLVMETFNIMLLTHINGNYETGLFNASMKILQMAYIPAMIMKAAYSPMISKANTIFDKREIAIKHIKINTLCGTFIAATVLLYPELVIMIVFGDKFISAANIIRIIMVNCVFAYYLMSIEQHLLMWCREKAVISSYFVIVVANILLNIVLIQNFAGIGAAFASLCSNALLMVFFARLMFKEIATTHLFLVAKLIILAALTVIFGYLSLLLLSSLLSQNVQTIYFQFVGIFISLLLFVVIIIKLNILHKNHKQ